MIQLFAFLANNLWEGAAVALAAWLVLRVARHANATTRYVVWTCALVAAVALPLLTTFAVGNTSKPASNAAYGVIPKVLVPKAHAAHLQVAPAAAQLTKSETVPRRIDISVTQTVVWAILAAWALPALWQLIRFGTALCELERLKRNATPLPIEYRRRLRRWAAARHVRDRVRLCVSDEILVPIAVGLFDAMILVPNSLLERLHADDVDRILLHEFAHLRRGDDWVHAFERIVSALCFFNPAVAFIVRHMDLEREVSCDDSVLECDGLEPVPYATCLTKMAEIVAWPYRPLAAPGVFDTRRSLSIRVERLLTSARDNRTRVAAVPALAAVLVIAAAGIAGAAVSPTFSLPCSAVRVAIQTYVQPPRPAVHAHLAVHQHTVVRPRIAVRIAAMPMVAVNPSPLPQASARADGDYIQELADQGYRGLSIEELVQLRSVGVDANYIRSIKDAGYEHPTARQLVQLRATGVTPQDMSGLRERLGALSLDRLVQLHALDVTGAYIDSIAAAGYRNLTADQLIQLRALNIDAAYIKKAQSRGFHNVTVHQLIELKATGLL